MMFQPEMPEGHRQTLLACFLHFGVSFMLWMLPGALSIYIADAVGLNASQKGLMVALPILTGSLLRVPLGALGDRLGGKRVGIGLLVVTLLPLVVGWQVGPSLPVLLAVGAMLGTAGASFAVVLPLASRWYPAGRQGLVMGIAAVGNGGTVLANVLAPRLADLVGWQNVFGLAILPLVVVLLMFAVMAKDSPGSVKPREMGDYSHVLKQVDLWWFCMFYCVTFGGYVGLTSFLPLFLRDRYQLDPVTAGSLTAVVALVGSGIRPLGGYLADRLGGVRVLLALLAGIGATCLAAATGPALTVLMGLLLFGMVCLGMGSGAIFQLVPQRFPSEIGIATGVIGAIGGLGGFVLPTLLGHLDQVTGSFGPGFLVLALIACGALLSLQVLLALRSGWHLSWRPAGVPEAFEES